MPEERLKVLIHLSRNQPARAKFKATSAPLHYSFLPFFLISSQHLCDKQGSIKGTLVMKSRSHLPLILSVEPGRQKMNQLCFLKLVNIDLYTECNSDQVNVAKNEETKCYNFKYSIPFYFGISALM